MNTLFKTMEVRERINGENWLREKLPEEVYGNVSSGAAAGTMAIVFMALMHPIFVFGSKKIVGDITKKANSVKGGSGTGNVLNENIRVGRWMSQAEYDEMIKTGRVQMSGDNKVHVANPADIDAFGKQAPRGSMYVEFDVPSNTMSSGGTDGWSIINGPGSLLDRLNA